MRESPRQLQHRVELMMLSYAASLVGLAGMESLGVRLVVEGLLVVNLGLFIIWIQTRFHA